VAVRAALDQVERRKRHQPAEGEPDRVADAGPDPHQAAAGGELARRVEAALDGLSPAQRAAFVCKQLEGLDTAQTARAMGCSRGTVRWHLFEARKRLADALAEGGDR
jgi:RNA polymerase sigma-70 factor (ECF subfamily)